MKQEPPAIYFIQEHLHRQPRHGGIGNKDIEKVLLAVGYIPIQFPGIYSSSLFTKVRRFWYLVRIACTLPDNAVIIFQHPLYAGIHRALVRYVAALRKVSFLCIILDIDGLRDGDPSLLNQELALFKRMDYLVVHNNKMAAWLRARGVEKPSANLQFFDFLARAVEIPRTKSPVVAYAGNLDRAGFVKKLGQVSGALFYIYGEPAPLQEYYSSNTVYKGAFDPYELADQMEGSFGLVWNGEEIDRLKGDYDKYLELISPHKLSQYIVAGLPVIVPEQAAVAELVRQLNIGFTVRSLSEIPGKIASLSEEAYQHYCRNCQQVAQRIMSGEGVSSAVKKLLSS